MFGHILQKLREDTTMDLNIPDTNANPDDSDAGSPHASDTESADMAAMMGFSSFGAKPDPPSKKRKLDQQNASLSGAGSGSGSNSMPLGKPRAQKTIAAGKLEESHAQDRERQGTNLDVANEAGEERLTSSEDISGAVEGTGHSQQLPIDPSVHSVGLGTGGGQVNYDWNALKKGIKDERGDVAYYDASFVEDPWKHLKG